MLDQDVVLSALNADAVDVRLAKIVEQVVNVVVADDTRTTLQNDPVFALANVIADECARPQNRGIGVLAGACGEVAVQHAQVRRTFAVDAPPSVVLDDAVLDRHIRRVDRQRTVDDLAFDHRSGLGDRHRPGIGGRVVPAGTPAVVASGMPKRAGSMVPVMCLLAL